MSESNLKVIARFRPIIDIEYQLQENQELSLKFLNDTTVSIPNSLNDYEHFIFDKIFPTSSSQQEIFEFCGKPIVEDVLAGYNGTVFAYGQTGSGKTYTMMGTDVRNDMVCGLIPRCLSYVFSHLSSDSSSVECTVKCSMLEIYKETLKDLLGSHGELKIKQDKRKGIYVEGLVEIYVVCEEETLDILAMGESSRTVASTKMNNVSSRSHQLFMLEICQKLPNGSEKIGRLNLVDLAGSEKINQTGVTGNKLEEAKKINLSLSALGNVIKALTEKADHIPYRDSKLTRLLQESLGGNFKTTLIVNCSPIKRNVEDTLNTLKFAQRAKCIKNKAVVNIKQSPEAYLKIIKELQVKLSSAMKELEIYKRDKPLSPITFRTGEKSPSELSFDSRYLECKIDESKIEEKIKLNDLHERLNSLKQDQEYNLNKVQELELELDRERIKRGRVEKENFELNLKYGNLVNNQLKVGQSENYYMELNKSLLRQIEMLKFHLQRINEKFQVYLEKIKEGEKVREWEFIDMNQMRLDENANLPVFTEEESLQVVNTSEFDIEIPIHESFLLKNDRYAQGLLKKLEDSSKVSKDLVIFELKKQFIQSGLVNSDLGRSYFELLWKYKLLREKLNLRSKLIHNQKQRIATLESLVIALNTSYSKLIEITEKVDLRKLELDQIHPRKIVRCIRGQNTVAPTKDLQLKFTRKASRTDSIVENKSLCRGSVLMGETNRSLILESNLQNQLMFNDQLKKSNDALTIERNTYKCLLDQYIKENQKVYLSEKQRWTAFLEEFKKSCEEELVRKQTEINKLNEILAQWMKRYMELDESFRCSNSRILTAAHKEQIQNLLGQTRIQTRPSKLQLVESPFHCRFKSVCSNQVINIDGDISPPNFE